MDSSDVFAFFALVIIFGAPCAVWMVSRVLAHQERMEMLRRGFTPPPDSREMRKAMKKGWVPGSATNPSANQFFYETDYYAQRQLRRGIQVACIGFALLIGLGFIGYRNGIVEPGPWLLGGLIPLFVGIAQIISAVLSGATLGAPASRQRFGPAPDQTVSTPGYAEHTVPPGPAYGGWRPGSLPEIEKPATPPDYRS